MIHSHEFWTLALSLTGGIQCLLLGSYFLLLKKGNLSAHRLFALLIGLVGLRLFKSAWYIYAGDEMPLILINLGFAAHLASGPLLVLYIWISLFGKQLKKTWGFHFLPTMGILIGTSWLSLEGFWYKGGYYGLLLISMAYWIYALGLLWKYKQAQTEIDQAQKRWLLSLMVMMSTFFIVYAANYFVGLLSYANVPLVYTLTLFPLSLSAWKSYEFLTVSPSQKQKYQNMELSGELIQGYQQKILHFIQFQKPYLTSGYSVKQLSLDTEIPSHIISLVLNQYLQTNFTALINQHRIDYACQLFVHPQYGHYSIAGIAFESGFNSLSVFNQSFKKIKGITPSGYRQSVLPK
ncbi:MAG: helix-turn-helix domain-containing protein [Saprospiraceae bacterium]